MDAKTLAGLCALLPEGVHWGEPLTPEILQHAVNRQVAELAALRAERDVLKADAERYRWLRANVAEAPVNPRAYGAAFMPDTRLRYVLPTVLVSWADYMGQRSLDDAIDAARTGGQ